MLIFTCTFGAQKTIEAAEFFFAGLSIIDKDFSGGWVMKIIPSLFPTTRLSKNFETNQK